MKKQLLALISIGFANFVAAQVTIDWSTDAILEPTGINSTVKDGSLVTYKFVGKNNGTDSAKIGDTLFYQVVLTTTDNNLIIAAPSVTSLYYTVLTRNVKPSDTIHQGGGFGWSQYPVVSYNININVISHIVNRKRGLPFEKQATLANNSKTQGTIWYCPQGWGVNVADINKGAEAGIFPNQVVNEFTVDLPWVSITESTTVKLYDLMGRVVMTTQIPQGSSNIKISAADLTNGTYIVKVSNSSLETSSKIVVQK